MDDCGCEATVGQIRRGFISAVNPLRVRFIGSLEDVPIAYQSVAADYMIGDEAICTEVAPAQWMLTDIIKPQSSGSDVVTGPQPPSFVTVTVAASDGSALHAAWTPAIRLGDTNGWQVQVREASSAGSVVATRLVTDVGTLSVELTGVTPGTTYWVGVAGAELDAADNVDALSAYVGYTITASSSPTPTRPDTPDRLFAGAAGYDRNYWISFDWTGYGEVDYYVVSRQTGGENEPWVRVGYPIGSPFIDRPWVKGAWQRYSVYAVGPGGVSSVAVSPLMTDPSFHPYRQGGPESDNSVWGLWTGNLMYASVRSVTTESGPGIQFDWNTTEDWPANEGIAIRAEGRRWQTRPPNVPDSTTGMVSTATISIPGSAPEFSDSSTWTTFEGPVHPKYLL